MGLSNEFGIAHEDVFPAGALFVRAEPINVYQVDRSAPARQEVTESGLPLWKVTVFDPDPRAKEASTAVRVASSSEPSVPASASPGMQYPPVVFTGLRARLKVEGFKIGQEAKARYSWAYEAAGVQPVKGASSGRKSASAGGDSA